MPVRAPTITVGDVGPETAGRRIGLTLTEFRTSLPALLDRGFPPPDPTTGLFDLDAVDQWRRNRHAKLYGIEASGTNAIDAGATGKVQARLGARREGKNPTSRRA